MSISSSEFLKVRKVDGAGRGVFARQLIPADTNLHIGKEPFAHVVFRQYRKEVCAKCFLYDRGRTLPIRDNQIGKVFCRADCQIEWNFRNNGPGYQTWKALQDLIQKHPKAVTNVSHHEPTGEIPTHLDVNAAWEAAREYVLATCSSNVFDASQSIRERPRKRPPPNSYDLVDPDLIGFFITAVLQNHQNQTVWHREMSQLAMNEVSYKSQYELDGHCASFVRLMSILSDELRSGDIMHICRLAIEAGSHNAFGIRAGGEDSEEYMGYGIYPSSSYFNHSCQPNIAKKRCGTAWMFSAAHDIAKDEQCCISYLGGDEKSLDTSQRRLILSESWGFDCMCARCSPKSRP